MISKLAVLVLEDNADDLDVICDSLRDIGVTRLVCVNTKEEALEYLGVDNDIDLIITNEGSSLISKVRKLYPQIESILCQRNENSAGGLKARGMGACEYIRKDNFKNNLEYILPPVVERVSLYQEVMYGRL